MKVATAGITIALFTTSLCSALPPTKKERVHDVVSLLTTSFISDIQFTGNDITTLALYGHGSETILFFSMGQGKVIHFPSIIWFYKHFL